MSKKPPPPKRKPEGFISDKPGLTPKGWQRLLARSSLVLFGWVWGRFVQASWTPYLETYLEQCRAWHFDNVALVSDKALYGVPEFWAWSLKKSKGWLTGREILQGDCEDIAQAERKMLRALNHKIHKRSLPMALVKLRGSPVADPPDHIVLLVLTTKRRYVLDSNYETPFHEDQYPHQIVSVEAWPKWKKFEEGWIR